MFVRELSSIIIYLLVSNSKIMETGTLLCGKTTCKVGFSSSKAKGVRSILHIKGPKAYQYVRGLGDRMFL